MEILLGLIVILLVCICFMLIQLKNKLDLIYTHTVTMHEKVDKPSQNVDKEGQPVYNPSYGDPEVKAYLDKMYGSVE